MYRSVLVTVVGNQYVVCTKLCLKSMQRSQIASIAGVTSLEQNIIWNQYKVIISVTLHYLHQQRCPRETTIVIRQSYMVMFYVISVTRAISPTFLHSHSLSHALNDSFINSFKNVVVASSKPLNDCFSFSKCDFIFKCCHNGIISCS